MKIISNKHLPFGKFGCMNVLGFLFVREEVELTDKVITHEAIHTGQQYEILTASALVALVVSNIYASWMYLLIVIAMPILLYALAWIVALALPPYDRAYKDSPFEREAYTNEHNPQYLATRPLFAWVKYIKR